MMPRRRDLKYQVLTVFTNEDGLAFKDAVQKVVDRMTARRNNEFLDALEANNSQGAAEPTVPPKAKRRKSK